MVQKLCYYDFVYLNEKKGKFKVTKDEKFCEPGYVKVNQLRMYWENSDAFDKHLKDLILLSKKAIDTQESHDVWKAF